MAESKDVPWYEQGALPPSEYRKSVLNKKNPTLKDVTKPSCGDKTHFVHEAECRDVKEQTVQGEIIRYLTAQGWYVHKVKAINLVGSGLSLTLAVTQKGVPDILACSPQGQFVAIEVKAPKKGARTSAYQRSNIDRIREAKGHAFVAHSVDCVKRYLEESKNLTLDPSWNNY